MQNAKKVLTKAKAGFNKAKNVALDGFNKAKDNAIESIENIDKEKVVKNTKKVLLFSGEATLYVGAAISKVISCSVEASSKNTEAQEAGECISEIANSIYEKLNDTGKTLSNIRKGLDEKSGIEISHSDYTNDDNFENEKCNNNYTYNNYIYDDNYYKKGD